MKNDCAAYKFISGKVGLWVILLFSFLMYGNVQATSITRDYTATTGCGVSNCGTNGGTLVFRDSASDSIDANQLSITFDNTTVSDLVGPDSYENSSVITGTVFNIVEDIVSFSGYTLLDGNNQDISSSWEVVLNIDSNITPGNTVVDLTFRTVSGIDGGIYNAADPGTNLNNVFPDIAKLVLTIDDPNPYTLISISDDILRMQRVGTNGDGSLKIPGQPGGGPGGGPGSIPEPGTLALLGAGMLGLAWRHRRLAKKAA